MLGWQFFPGRFNLFIPLGAMGFIGEMEFHKIEGLLHQELTLRSGDEHPWCHVEILSVKLAMTDDVGQRLMREATIYQPIESLLLMGQEFILKSDIEMSAVDA